MKIEQKNLEHYLIWSQILVEDWMRGGFPPSVSPESGHHKDLPFPYLTMRPMFSGDGSPHGGSLTLIPREGQNK